MDGDLKRKPGRPKLTGPKRCPRCGLEKNRTEFRKSYCVPCDNEYQLERINKKRIEKGLLPMKKKEDRKPKDIPPNKKWCPKCELVLWWDEFSPKGINCKQCCASYKRTYRNLRSGA